MPGFDASGSFIDKEGALPLRKMVLGRDGQED